MDGFNFYYGAVKNTPYKWLNFARLVELLLPGDEIVRIKYFTAQVKPRPDDPEMPLRQQIYLRALRTIPHLEIHLGQFNKHKVWMPAVCAPGEEQRNVRVWRTEEKGSDVNLATQLLCDAYENHFGTAAIISGDSDLLAPIRVVRHRLGKQIGVLSPQRRPAISLSIEANFYKEIRSGVLEASQFPDALRDRKGEIRKPGRWRE